MMVYIYQGPPFECQIWAQKDLFLVLKGFKFQTLGRFRYLHWLSNIFQNQPFIDPVDKARPVTYILRGQNLRLSNVEARFLPLSMLQKNVWYFPSKTMKHQLSNWGVDPSWAFILPCLNATSFGWILIITLPWSTTARTCKGMVGRRSFPFGMAS